MNGVSELHITLLHTTQFHTKKTIPLVLINIYLANYQHCLVIAIENCAEIKLRLKKSIENAKN